MPVWTHRFRSLLTATGLAACTFGCFTVRNVPVRNVVMFDAKGRPMDPTGNISCKKTAEPDALCNGKFSRFRAFEVLDPPRFDRYVADMLREAESTASPGSSLDGRRHVRLLLFVHGGLNDPESTLERVAKKTCPMRNAGAYPIFINWQSSLASNLTDHLLWVRRGKNRGPNGLWYTPPLLVADSVRAVGKAPYMWMQQAGSAYRGARATSSPEKETSNQAYCRLRRSYEADPGGSLAIAKGQDLHTGGETAASATVGVVTVIPKLIASPFLDAFGSPAWDMMERRTHLLFHASREESNDGDVIPEAGIGGLSVFLAALKDRIDSTSCGGPGAGSGCIDWEIDLIGHSMGTIVVNEILRRFPGIRFDDIVYMAAACSVRDIEDSAYPYLRDPRNRSTSVHHLLLHDLAELRENYAWHLPPRGSLLVWVDNYFGHPGTLRDRTAGRFSNLLPTLAATPDELRPRISVKTFGYGRKLRGKHPQGHGDFGDFPFWDPEFWDPANVPLDDTLCSQIPDIPTLREAP